MISVFKNFFIKIISIFSDDKTIDTISNDSDYSVDSNDDISKVELIKNDDGTIEFDIDIDTDKLTSKMIDNTSFDTDTISSDNDLINEKTLPIIAMGIMN